MCFIKIDIIPLLDIVIYEFEHWKRNHDFFLYKIYANFECNRKYRHSPCSIKRLYGENE